MSLENFTRWPIYFLFLFFSLSTFALDQTQPQCADSARELQANRKLKAKLKGYNPFTSWIGDHSDIKVDEQTGKLQAIIHRNLARLAAMMGYSRVNPLTFKVCVDAKSSRPYLDIEGTKYDTLLTSVTLKKDGHSETYRIESAR